MVMAILGLIIALWLLYSGWKFYRQINWDEAPEPSPDLQGMRKKQAELMHIQDVLSEAADKGKLSRAVVEEFNRYSEGEIAAMQAVETAWKDRHKPKSAQN